MLELQMVTEELISPTDIVGSIIAKLPDFSVKKLPTDRRTLHSIFFALREEGFSILSDFAFDNSDMYPYCPVVDEAISNLQITKDLERKNPDLDIFDISDSVVNYYNNVLQQKFQAPKLEEINKVAEKFAERVSK